METSSQDKKPQSLFNPSGQPMNYPKYHSKELFICKICPSRMQEQNIMRHFNEIHSKVEDIHQYIVLDFETKEFM
jgi:hypothetical protein